MTKAHAFILSLTASLLLAACSHQGERQLASLKASVNAAAAEPSLATPVLGQPLVLNNCVIDKVTSDVVGQKIYTFARKASGKAAKKQASVFSDEKCQREIARQ